MADGTRKIRRGLTGRGYLVETTRGMHLKITHPTRPGVVFTSSTPGDGQRGNKNLDRDLRRTFGADAET
jgi:hypothetical protein